MSRKMEYELKGKSDVEQVTGRAKKSMSQLDSTMAAVNKKFSEIGKDLFNRFLAPVMLIDKAINVLTDSIAKMTATAAEGIDSIANTESMLISPELQAAADRARLVEKAKKDSLTFVEDMRKMTKTLLLETNEGKAMLYQLMKENFSSLLLNPVFFVEQMAMREDVQNELIRRIGKAAPKSKTEPTTTASQQKFADAKSVSGDVIGMGQSPVIAAMTETNDILRRIEANTAPAQPTLTPDPNLTKKGPPLLYPQFK
jgi:hypothetical protein